MRRLVGSRIGLVLALLGDLLLQAGPQWSPEVSATDLSAALAAQERVTDEWLRLDGVVGTAIGLDAAGEVALKVYLTEPKATFLPETVAGVPVLPEVTGPFRALGDRSDADAEASDDVDPKEGFPRPVPIGVSTSHPDVTAGTIGARVTDGIRVFALSNNHVFANSNGGRPGDNLLQPGVADGGRNPDDVVGTLHDFETIRFCTGFVCPPNRIDAALAATTPDDLGHATPDNGYGSPRSRVAEAELEMNVQKYGRTTGHTRGVISGIHATIDVGYGNGRARFTDQIVISGDRGDFSAGGDSGSLVVTRGVFAADRRPVGLLFAGSNTSTLANPIDDVLDHFDVTVDGGR